MTRDEARAALNAALEASRTAYLLLRPQMAVIAALEAESRLMESVGPILFPTLFRDPERRETEALITPVLQAARHFVEVFDLQSKAAAAALTQRLEASA